MQETTGRLSELRTERGGEKVHKKLFRLFPFAGLQELKYTDEPKTSVKKGKKKVSLSYRMCC